MIVTVQCFSLNRYSSNKKQQLVYVISVKNFVNDIERNKCNYSWSTRR